MGPYNCSGVTENVGGSEKVRNVVFRDLIQRVIVRQAQRQSSGGVSCSRPRCHDFLDHGVRLVIDWTKHDFVLGGNPFQCSDHLVEGIRSAG